MASNCTSVCCVNGLTATPDPSDPAVCNAGKGAIFIGTGGAMYVRTALSVPCLAADWTLLTGAVPMTKNVINNGATLPITVVAHQGTLRLLTDAGTLQFAETDDIVPTIGTDRAVNLYKRQVCANRFLDPAGAVITTSTITQLSFAGATSSVLSHMTANNGGVEVVSPGIYRVNGSLRIPHANGDPMYQAVLRITRSGVALTNTNSGSLLVPASTLDVSSTLYVGGIASFSAGDIVGLSYFHTKGSDQTVQGFQLSLEKI